MQLKVSFAQRRAGSSSLVRVCFVQALAVVLVLLCVAAAGAEESAAELVRQARLIFNRGLRQDALELVNRALKLEPTNSSILFYRARVHESLREHAKAIADYDRLIEREPKSAQLYQLRGSEHFRAGHIKESIADFDKYLEFMPGQAAHHWQRGISYYYAGRFAEGRRQFDLHQTVNPNDVENAVWHFLCVAREEGVEKAREALLPIQMDRRVPMMQIYALFGGKGSAEEVLAAAEAGQPSPEELKQRLFYAHLYLGLYYEAAGNAAKSAEHIAKAAGPYAVDHYMGDVARVHAQLRPATSK